MKLVKNARELARIQKLWSAVRRLADERSQVHALPDGDIEVGRPMPDAYFNLPVVLAVSALEETLEAARNENAFRCHGARLGMLMEASKARIPWRNFDAVDRIREKRNDIAHEGILYSRSDCLQMIAHIEAELSGWGVLG
jgi:hypothetical protein